jgi:glycosyltransferase involved in cell wall biosynthesis
MPLMRIAILGTRGIPANYGGFETFAEELSTRLVARGHAVTVYCRERYPETTYRGVRLRYLPPLRHKYAETLAHTLLSTLDLMRHPHDAALYCNGANAIFTPLARAAGMPVALNVDGLERNRRKWNLLARGWYLFSEILSTFCPTELITDAARIQLYYQERYGAKSTFIPYGAPTGKLATAAALERLGLEPERYLLYVTRFEPENNPLMVRQAFERVETGLKLALIGDAPYAAEYVNQVRDTRDPRIVIPGGVYGDGYHELQSHSFAYIHATEVGGTHPALIEAMGRGALVLYLMTPENHEVAGGAAIPFRDADELAARLRQVLAMTQEERDQYRAAAAARVRERYSWEAVTDSYEQLFLRLQGAAS